MQIGRAQVVIVPVVGEARMPLRGIVSVDMSVIVPRGLREGVPVIVAGVM